MVAEKSALAATGQSVAAILLGDMARLPPIGWAILLFVCLLGVLAGATARQAHYETSDRLTADQIKSSRRFAMMIIPAQLGVSICAVPATGGNILIALAVALTVGFTGITMLRQLARRTSGIGESSSPARPVE